MCADFWQLWSHNNNSSRACAKTTLGALFSYQRECVTRQTSNSVSIELAVRPALSMSTREF